MRRAGGLKGFTLIELLVVVLVILILAAILFPVLASAQRSALRAKCASNMRQIMAAIAIYVQDTGGRLPLAYDADPSAPYDFPQASLGVTWNERILRYVKNKSVFFCPSVPDRLLTNTNYFKSSYQGGPITTYGFNWRLSSNGGDQRNSPLLFPHSSKRDLQLAGLFGVPVTVELLRQPSRTVMICESQHGAERLVGDASFPTIKGGGGFVVYSDEGNYYWLIRWLTKPYIPQGHIGGANFGLADGHVQFVRGLQPDQSSAAGPGKPPQDSSVRAAGLRWW